MIGIHRCIFLFDFSITMGTYSQLLSNYTVVDHNQKKLSYSSENVSADMLNGALPWEQQAERGNHVSYLKMYKEIPFQVVS